MATIAAANMKGEANTMPPTIKTFFPSLFLAFRGPCLCVERLWSWGSRHDQQNSWEQKAHLIQSQPSTLNTQRLQFGHCWLELSFSKIFNEAKSAFEILPFLRSSLWFCLQDLFSCHSSRHWKQNAVPQLGDWQINFPTGSFGSPIWATLQFGFGHQRKLGFDFKLASPVVKRIYRE